MSPYSRRRARFNKTAKRNPFDGGSSTYARGRRASYNRITIYARVFVPEATNGSPRYERVRYKSLYCPFIRPYRVLRINITNLSFADYKHDGRVIWGRLSETIAADGFSVPETLVADVRRVRIKERRCAVTINTFVNPIEYR